MIKNSTIACQVPNMATPKTRTKRDVKDEEYKAFLEEFNMLSFESSFGSSFDSSFGSSFGSSFTSSFGSGSGFGPSESFVPGSLNQRNRYYLY